MLAKIKLIYSKTGFITFEIKNKENHKNKFESGLLFLDMRVYAYVLDYLYLLSSTT